MLSTSIFSNPLGRYRAASGLLAAGLLMAGCATTSSTVVTVAEPAPASVEPLPSSTFIPVVRYGRYTLVELTPEAAQQDLLLQVIDVSMPATLSATVGDALRYVLLRSGYTLCEADTEAATLYDLPLPAAHLHLGPFFLRDVLLTLAGPAWDLQVDDVARRVCFARRSEALP